jgi:hypothetical protein
LLSSRDYQRLRPHLPRIPLTYRQSLYRARQPLGFVHFIETGVGSLVNTMANGQAAEVGTIGNEGVVGLPLLLGDDRAPTIVYVQVPGALFLKPSDHRRRLLRWCAGLDWTRPLAALRMAHCRFRIPYEKCCSVPHGVMWVSSARPVNAKAGSRRQAKVSGL